MKPIDPSELVTGQEYWITHPEGYAVLARYQRTAAFHTWIFGGSVRQQYIDEKPVAFRTEAEANAYVDYLEAKDICKSLNRNFNRIQILDGTEGKCSELNAKLLELHDLLLKLYAPAETTEK